MKQSLIWVGLLLVVIVVLVFLGWSSGYVGNVAIRRVQPAGVRVDLDISQPVVPGVHTDVHWSAPRGTDIDEVIFEARSSQENFFIGQGKLADDVATLNFPCTIDDTQIGLVMIDAESEQVLGFEQVQLLPAGPDCLH